MMIGSKSDKSTRKPAVDLAKPEISPSSSMDSGSVDAARPTTSRRTKPKPFRLLSRSKSLQREQRDEHGRQSPQEAVPIQVTQPSPRLDRANTFDSAVMNGSLPSQDGDRLDSEMARSEIGSLRSNQRSEGSVKSHHKTDENQPTVQQNIFPKESKKSNGRDREPSRERHGKHHDKNNQSVSQGTNLFNTFKNSATKGISSIGKGIWGKGGRSSSTIEKEPPIDDEHYVLKVINLPLVEQTRMTRISKKLEKSRDKTEYWMPAFPWRAIDYLNYKGSEVEGLYRVPGSGPQVKRWQRRFDEGKKRIRVGGCDCNTDRMCRT